MRPLRRHGRAGQVKRGGYIKRKTPLPRPTKPIARRSRIKRMDLLTYGSGFVRIFSDGRSARVAPITEEETGKSYAGVRWFE